jgi:FkbM family methyltransferase
MILFKVLIFKVICLGNFQRYLEAKFFFFKLAVFLKIYDPVEIGILKNFVNEGDIVVDGGANFGIYSKKLLPIVGTRGKVYAFEPLDFMCDFMGNKIKANNFLLFQCALSDLATIQKLYVPYIAKNLKEPALATLLEGTPNSEIIEVKTIQLDSIVELDEKITFIKLDLEGHEFAALKGAKNLLKNSRPVIQFEDNNFYENLDAWKDFSNEYNYLIYKFNRRFIPKNNNYYLLPMEKHTAFIESLSKRYVCDSFSAKYKN